MSAFDKLELELLQDDGAAEASTTSDAEAIFDDVEAIGEAAEWTGPDSSDALNESAAYAGMDLSTSADSNDTFGGAIAGGTWDIDALSPITNYDTPSSFVYEQPGQASWSGVQDHSDFFAVTAFEDTMFQGPPPPHEFAQEACGCCGCGIGSVSNGVPYSGSSSEFESGTGNGTVAVAVSGNAFIDGVLTNTAWSLGGGGIDYSFPTNGTPYNYTTNSAFVTNLSGLTAQQQTASHFALNTLYNANAGGFSAEGFTNLNIVFDGSPDTDEIRLANTSSALVSTARVADFPSNDITGQVDDNGDVWFGGSGTTPTAGNYHWHTVIHEIGHALGLSHGHSTYQGGVPLPAAFDSMEYSIMTYRAYVGAPLTGYGNETWGFAQTFMMADIAALQYMYGADFTTNSGNTVYKWNPGSGDTLVNGGVAIDAGGNRIFATIWDGGGIDTYDLSSYTTGVSVNLNPGFLSFDLDQGYQYNSTNSGTFSGTWSGLENLMGGSASRNHIIGNSSSNVLTGGSNNDTLLGEAGNDTLNGGAGNDMLEGGSGVDVVNGGAGNDTIVQVNGWSGGDTYNGGGGTDTVDYSGTNGYNSTANLGTGSLTGSGAAITLSSIENILAGNGADSITGSNGTNLLDGGAGNDTIVGGGGSNDTLLGGAGNDSITANSGLTLVDGGAGDDIILGVGGAGTNTLLGGAGNDQLRAVNLSGFLTDGGTGNDTITFLGGNTSGDIDGGSGTDHLDGTASGTAFTANLLTEQLSRLGTYDLMGIENVTGSAFGDTLIGAAGANLLNGGAGNDSITGGSGVDTLIGGTGNDTLEGDTGSTTSHMDGGSGNDLMMSRLGNNDSIVGGSGIDTLQLTLGGTFTTADRTIDIDQGYSFSGGPFQGDWSGLENLISAANLRINLIGNSLDNLLQASSQDDTILGEAGNDTLLGLGNKKANVLDGGAGDDTLAGGKGADTLIFTEGLDTFLGFEDNLDTVVLEDGLWGGGKTFAQVLADHGSHTGSTATLNFGGGDVLTITGVGALNDLVDDMAFI